MIRMKKWLSCLVAALAVFCLTGCGGNGISDALVVGENVSDEAVSEVWASVQGYASSLNTMSGRYTAGEKASESFAEAVKAGADSIVVMGSELDTAFYAAQKKYKKVHFIGLDVEPREKEGEEVQLLENTVCVTYDKAQLGFMAGYAAVYAGNQKLGFIAGTEDDEAREYLNGFIAGADAAGQALNAGAGSISISVWYAGGEKLTPVVMDKALSLYDAGCQVIMTRGNGLIKAVNEAAKKRSKTFISAGSDWTDTSEQCLMGMTFNTGETAKSLLEKADSEDFSGGDYLSCGVSENSLSLVCRYESLGSFDEKTYESLYKSLSDGEETSDGDFLNGTELVTVTSEA